MGKFITFEGCEGVGKSTQVKRLKEYFERYNIKAFFTREPGGNDIAEKIRNLILDARNGQMHAMTELLLYEASRVQHIEQTIRPKLDDGYIVVCDRFIDSTLAYQGYGRGLDKDQIRSLNSLALGGLEIDLTLFINLSPAEGFKRKGGADKKDRLEQAGLDFHERVYSGFMEMSEQLPRFRSVDGRGNATIVFSRVVEELKKAQII